MKTTKLTVKFFLIISLFASITLADDGSMNNGGLSCNPEVETCANDDGSMNNGGFADDGSMNNGGLTDSVLIFVKDYLAKLLG
jgi:hypothetical protein